MQYNTQLERIEMREYGRYIQKCVEKLLEEPDRQVRQQYANDIVGAMTKFSGERGNSQEKQAKIWNHLAYIADYKLDIDYPVKIVREK